MPENKAAAAFASLKQIDAGDLNVGYAEAGPVDGTVVVLLHGWPYDIHCYMEVTGSLATAGYRVIVPYLRGFGTTRFRADDTMRSGEQAASAADLLALLDALGIDRAILAGFDWGSRTADAVAALWPDRCKGLVSVSGYLLSNPETGQEPLPPKAEYGWWYQYYFATERGRSGYDRYRKDFAKLVWQIASPKWYFDDATFDRSAAALDNPDHTGIVIHNYRWRQGLADGDPQYADLERSLVAMPTIEVPTITIASDFDGPLADGSKYAKQFTGKYTHRILQGIGHNVPQEAPDAFTEAILEVDRY
jgi:pimeloyl-ACP methyl ester carboxylesterase